MTALQTLTNGAVTATSNSANATVPSVVVNTVAVTIAATAVTGTTPSLTTQVQWSNDGVNWANAAPADSFAAITAAGNVVVVFTIKGLYMRLAYTVSGTTPSFTLIATALFV